MSAPSPSLPPPPYEKAIKDAAVPQISPIIRTPHSPPPPSISPNTRDLERKVHQVVNIMESNLERVMERGENLDSLNHRARMCPLVSCAIAIGTIIAWHARRGG